MGKRLGELTKDGTKCTVEVNGERLIDRTIRLLAGLGLTRLVLVVGYKGKELRQYIGHRYDDVLPIEYIDNPIYDRTNNIYSLALAKDALCEDDTLLLESDIIFDGEMLQLLVNHPDPNLALVAKYEPWMDGTMVCIGAEREIVNFVPKAAFRYEDTDIYYKTVNIYKFSREFSRHEYVPFLNAYCQVMGRNEYYEDVLRIITMLDTTSLKALPVGRVPWYEIDDVQDLDIASVIFASGTEKSRRLHSRYGGFWRFPQMLDFCYLVNPFFPPERMRQELRSNFDTLLTQYPSGMAVNSLLAGKCFGIRQEYVAVGNGAAELIKSAMERFGCGRVGVVYPTFEEYPNRLPQDSIVPFTPGNADYRYTADDLIAYYNDKQLSLLVLINPDNPSGNYIAFDDVLRLAAWCEKRDCRLLLDESFVDFATGYPTNTMLRNDLLAAHPGMVVVKSISKSYGVPGLRLGVLASADTALIAEVKKDVSIWNINSFAEYYMQIFGKYEKDYRRACTLFAKERAWLYGELQRIPLLRVMPSEANYFLCEVTGGMTSSALAEHLLQRGIIISDCARKTHTDGRNLIRLAIRSREDNLRLLAALKAIY